MMSILTGIIILVNGSSALASATTPAAASSPFAIIACALSYEKDSHVLTLGFKNTTSKTMTSEVIEATYEGVWHSSVHLVDVVKPNQEHKKGYKVPLPGKQPIKTVCTPVSAKFDDKTSWTNPAPLPTVVPAN